MEKLQDNIGYQFKDSSLLEEALTHPSVRDVHALTHLRSTSYERLEFLGDSVLALVMAEILWNRYPQASEGELAKRHAALVCGRTLALVAASISLGEVIHMHDGEAQSGGRENPANLENALEALIGALYLDGGIEAAKIVIQPLWQSYIDKMIEPPKDPKTTLQEWAQSKKKPLPVYEVVTTDGPAHAPHFTISVSVEGLPDITAEGASKRKAQREAAKHMLKYIEQQEAHD